MNYKNTELYAAMKSSGNYDTEEDIKEAFEEMVEAVQNGADPEEILHDEGFEPDYVFDLIGLCSGI